MDTSAKSSGNAEKGLNGLEMSIENCGVDNGNGTDHGPSQRFDQSNIHVYPDWAAMQAYYGPRLAVPPYVVAPGHAPHPYMWGPLQDIASLSMNTFAKSSGNTEKGLNGLGMSIENCSVDNGDGTDHGPSQRFVQYQFMREMIFNYLRLNCGNYWSFSRILCNPVKYIE
ncbi:hypothetical protein RND71_028439 [Anisodus tanguticus]|uniref:G-box binding protein multifunctional mosaic region domain-containing protein n=1 Tax=Anisodus tanguticus TaxID=243964 RepID=A0AAE1RJR9_9SOLA|nr:hypothetical protein RND71_028439 [Anisodus tanguticus]